MLRICHLLRPDMLATFTGQDLTNTLWGFARLFPGGASGAANHVKQVSVATHAIIRQCIQKVDALTSQPLANSLWSMARLKVHGPDVDEYVRLAQGRMGAHGLDSFTPQGLANVLWALAQLRLAGVGKDPQDDDMRPTLVALAEAGRGKTVQTQLPWPSSSPLLPRPRSRREGGEEEDQESWICTVCFPPPIPLGYFFHPGSVFEGPGS